MATYARSLGIAIVAALLGASASARADAVPPPPADCPPGTEGATDHYGPHCAPVDCQSDADCGGKRCRPHALCVFDRVFESPRGNTHRREAKGACDKGQACPLDSPCRSGNYCFAADVAPPPSRAPAPAPAPSPGTPSPAASSPPPRSGCAVGASTADGAVGAAMLGLAGLLLGALRSRRPRRA